MNLECQCGAKCEFDETKFMPGDSNNIIVGFTKTHEPCRQAYITKTQAEARRALTVKIDELQPGEILETLYAPDYSETLNNIAEHLSNIEMNTRKNK